MANGRKQTSAFAILPILLGALILVGPVTADPQPLFTGTEERPADAIVLFDGTDLSAWVKQRTDKPAGWKAENGYMEVVPGTGDICTKQQFGDCQLHIEFWLPLMPDAKGQARANSGVYLQNRYEIQVLDSYGLNSQAGDCGAIYGVAAPLVNACRPPEHWQTYDAVFRAPTVDKQGNLTSKPRITVFHNGVLIHENVEIPGSTIGAGSGEAKATGPIKLQDHRNRVRYRNIWVRKL